jgi:hypothetical protein
MIQFPTERNIVLLDSQNDEFWGPIKELVDEYFPLREEYWSFLSLFEIQCNGSYMYLDQERIDDRFEGWDANNPDHPETQRKLLNKEFKLTRRDDSYDEQLTLVLWTLQQKGLIAPLTDIYLIRVWW